MTMKTKIEKGRLIISLKIRKPKLSKSGKMMVLASSRGVRASNVVLENKRVLVTAHAFIDVDDSKKAANRRFRQGRGVISQK